MHYVLIDRNVQLHRARFFTGARGGGVLQIAAYSLFAAGLGLGVALWGTPFSG